MQQNRVYTLSSLQICIGIIVIILVGIFLDAFLHYFFSVDETVHTEELRLNSQEYKFINPLILSSEQSVQPLLPREVSELQQNIENFTSDSIEHNQITYASVYYRDLNNGPWFKVGDDNKFTAASLLKVPMMIAYFKEAEKDPSILEKVITYEKPYANAPLYSVDSSQEKIELGKSYTVLELIEDMIINSDNLAAYLLVEHIDAGFVAEIFRDFGFTFQNGQITEKFITPKEYAGFLRVLYNASYLNRAYSEKSLEILSRSSFSHGMRSALPPEVTASIKYGISATPFGEKQLHECGIIYWPTDKPHVLCIMTLGTDYDALAAYVKNVTTMVQTAIKE